jgi:hypothetical protein
MIEEEYTYKKIMTPGLMIFGNMVPEDTVFSQFQRREDERK